MEIEKTPTTWIKIIQDYISQLKNCIIAIEAPETFVQKQGSIGNPYTDDKLKKMEEIKKYVEGNQWVQEIILNFIESVPLIMADHRLLKRQEKLYACDLLGGLVAQAFKATLNLWSVYEKCCSILAEVDRSKNYYVKFYDSMIVDFVKIGQALMYMSPSKSKIGDDVPAVVVQQFSTLLKSVESDKFYLNFQRKMERFGEYWLSQIKRDLMNQRTAIPDPIIHDRLKECKNMLELLHFYKLVIKISDESKLVKSAYWQSNFLFREYLFGQNIEIYIHAEKTFGSLGILCRNAAKFKNHENQKFHEYYELINSLFISVVDLFDVTFYKLLDIHAQMIKKTKKENDGTRGFLKQMNFEDFVLQCGHVIVKGSNSKKMNRDDCKNVRFFKILLYYSKGFEAFVKKMANSLSNETNMSSQLLCIFNQMIGEVKAFSIKAIEQKEYNEKRKEEEEKTGKVKTTIIKPDKEFLAEKERQRSTFKEQDEMSKFLKIKPTSEAIIFSNEQDEEGGYKNNHKMSKKMDKKTQSYLEYIKQYQYNDEMDDSLEFGARIKNKRRGGGRKRNNNKNPRLINMKAEKIEEIDEDDLEDENPTMNRNSNRRNQGGRRKHKWETENEEMDNQDDNRGYHRGSRGGGVRGSRGNFRRRGRGSDHHGGYRGRQKANRNKREYNQKNR